MSIATQVKRLQDVRNQIRAKMVALGLSENTDLLQKLANDLDGVDKISPTKDTADPGIDYTNVDTLSRDINTRYIKIPKGYNGVNRKFTVDGVADGSVAKATIDDPGAEYANKSTVTPTKSTQYVKVTAGYLPNSKITVEGIPKRRFTLAQSAWSATSSAKETGSYTCTVSGVTGVKVDNDVTVLPDDTSVVDSCGVYASSQGAESITFKAFDKPTSDISYTVYILNK